MMQRYNNLKKQLWSFDRSYLTTHSPWLFGGKILSTLLVLAVAYVFANYASPETYGTYKYLLALVGIISALSLSGLADVISRETARHGLNILRDAYRLTLRWHSLFFVGAATLGTYYLWQSNTELGYSLWVIAISYPLTQSALVAKRYLFGKAAFKLSTNQEISAAIIRSLVVISSILLFDSTLAVILAYFTSELLLNTAFYWYVAWQERTVPVGTINQQSFTFAKHMSVVKIFNKIAQHIDGVIIFQFLGPAQLAIYTIAVAIPKEIEGLNKPLQALILPKVSNLPLHTIQKIISYRALLYIVPFIGLAALYYVVSPYIFSFLFPQYIAAIPLSQVAILILLASPHNLYRQSLFAHDQIKALYTLDILVAIVKVVSSFLFIFWFGIIGAVYALLVGRATRLLLSAVLLQKSRTV